MRNLTTPDGRSVMLYDSNSPGQNVIPPTLINTYSVLTIPAYWRAMNFLANNLASFPRSIHKEGSPADRTHPLNRLLGRRPNSYQSGWRFWSTLFFHAAHCLNAYARIERGPNLRPVALHNLLPADIMPFRVIDKTGQVSQWYVNGPTKEVYAGADVIHLSGLGYDGMAGVDPVHLHSDTFQRAKTIDRYQTRFLMRGTVVVGAIQIPTGVDDDQVQKIRDRLRTHFRGYDAEDDTLVLSDGATLNNQTLTPQQSQLVEQTAHSTKQIAQITGVPPQFLYDLSEGKYNSVVEQAGIDVVRFTFRPWIEQTEDELTGKLLTTAEQDAGYEVKLDANALTRGDTKSVSDTVVQQVNARIRTPNEARDVLELPKSTDPEADKLKALGDTAPKPANAPPTPKDGAA